MNDEKIKIDISKYPFCFRTIKISGFTNKLKNEEEFSKKFKIIVEELIPHVTQYTFNNIQNSTRHCHPVTDSQKIKLIFEIVGNLVEQWKPGVDKEKFLVQNLEGEVLWELGVRDVRLIGIRKSTTFHLLFVDYHHLIYPSEKYNDKEYSRNKFSIIE